MKEFADDHFKFDRNGRKFFEWLENTVGKEKSLFTSNFFFSHCVFKSLVLQTRKNQGLFGKGLSIFFYSKLHIKVIKTKDCTVKGHEELGHKYNKRNKKINLVHDDINEKIITRKNFVICILRKDTVW